MESDCIVQRTQSASWRRELLKARTGRSPSSAVEAAALAALA